MIRAIRRGRTAHQGVIAALTVSAAIDIPFDYEVIGQHRYNLDALLLLGSDGQCYALCLKSGECTLPEVAEDWVQDVPVGRVTSRRLKVA